MLVGCTSTGSLDGFDNTTIEVGDTELEVAVAETLLQRNQGLRGVERLPEGIDGMLFVFHEERSATFGMGNTPIPLDIWWFDGEGRLLGSTEMDPCGFEPCPGYGSPGPVAWALETPRGELELVPGDTLTVVGGS